MNDWQYSNPFFLEGYTAAESGKKINNCPYDYMRYEDENDIQTELYRQQEWYAGYNSYKNGVKDEKSGS